MNVHRLSMIAISASCFVASANAAELKITSDSFRNGDSIPPRFSRGGGNRNPALHIESTPSNAKSLALIVDDPDAPGGLFTHWLVWNIDPKTTSIAEHRTPKEAMEGTNDFGAVGYGGPNHLPARIVTTSKFLRSIKNCISPRARSVVISIKQ